MLRRFHTRTFCLAFALLLVLCATATRAMAQSATTSSNGDDEEAATKLFERGQDAHARGQLAEALKLYEEAIKLTPEFPEAEYQRGAVLVSLNRYDEAERAYRRAIELRADWALPHAALSALLFRTLNSRQNDGVVRFTEAEILSQRALELDPTNYTALTILADLRSLKGKQREALELLRRATANSRASASVWAARAKAERLSGDTTAAAMSLERAHSLEPQNLLAQLERAELRLAANDREGAAEAARTAEQISSVAPSAEFGGKDLLNYLFNFYWRVGKKEDALRIFDRFDEATKNSPEMILARSELTGTVDANVIRTLEQLSKRNPPNASIFSRLGAAYRTTDPARSLDYYRRAAELEPANVDYATGYASALVQARRFPEAVVVLRRILAVAPDTYAAHANLAAALDELKSYAEAIVEYNWLTRARPELAITYYFIGRDHDLLEEYREALAAYETFLQHADKGVNALEIDKVNLRLPILRDQIKRGRGRKPRGAKP
ncbi:MAG: tetratricopeptide repeat protein [Pyrinomonadaceae bacterium]|nr:tetratricopeptide repeat protein [Pyrinomonadaceae bacterium]